MAPTQQADTPGCRRHSRQAAHHGGPQVQHPQVCPGGVRPRHDPPEPSQPQPRLCSLQLPVEGNGEPCVHPQTATMHFSLVLKQQVGRVLAASRICIHTVVWRGCCGSTEPWTVVHYKTTSVWHAERWRLPSSCKAPDVNGVTFRSYVAAVGKRWFPVQGCIEVCAYSTWMCWSCVSGSNVKEFPSILYNATAKESNCQKRDLTYLYETQKTYEWITAIFYTIAFYILIFYRDTCIL